MLVNGTLNDSDVIVCCTTDGPITRPVRALLTPPPSKEMRVKSEYEHHKTLSDAIGLRISAVDLDTLCSARLEVGSGAAVRPTLG